MEYNEIIKIIKTKALDCGCMIEIRDSISTKSHYFKLKSGSSSMLFRISDHESKKDIKTLRMDRNVTRAAVQEFADACIKSLNHRAFKQFMRN